MAGMLVAELVIYLLGLALDDEQMFAWGWRVPFFIGMLIAPVGMYIRRHLHESLEIAPDASAKPRESSLRIVCTQHGGTVLASSG